MMFGGVGIIESLIIILLYALFVLVFYVIIKAAVKNGILEAKKILDKADKGKSPKGDSE